MHFLEPTARQGLERDMLLSLLRHSVHVGAEIVIKRSRRLKHGCLLSYSCNFNRVCNEVNAHLSRAAGGDTWWQPVFVSLSLFVKFNFATKHRARFIRRFEVL